MAKPHAGGLDYGANMIDHDSPGHGRAVAGTVATLLWLALWAFAIWGDFAAGAIVRRETALTLNEWGALAAAIIAPIGVLWLVLGYFQQAAAVARNTAALQAQVRMLAMQSEHSLALVQEHARNAAATAALTELELAAHRRHEDARRALLAPDLRFESANFSAGHRLASFAMVNAGGPAYGLSFHSEDFADGRLKPAELVERNARFTLHVTLDPVLRDQGGSFALRCRDVEGREHAFPFRTEDGAVVPADAPPRSRRAEAVGR
jgi:hypothetical protein